MNYSCCFKQCLLLPGKSSNLHIVDNHSSDTYLVINQDLEGQHVHYSFAQNSKSVLASHGLTAMATAVLNKEHLSLCSLKVVVNAISKDTSCKTIACSQQKYQCGHIFFCHVHGLHIINPHIM